MPSRAKPAEHGVDGCWIVGIEGGACDESPGQVARDVFEAEASERICGNQNPPSDSDNDIVAVGRRDVHCIGASRGSEPSSARSSRRPCFARDSVCCSRTRRGHCLDRSRLLPGRPPLPKPAMAARCLRRIVHRSSTGRSSHCSFRRHPSRSARRARRLSRRRPRPSSRSGRLRPQW